MRYNRLIKLLLMASLATAHAQTKTAAPPAFTVEGDHFVLNGKPFKVLSGELHYARIPREYWRQRLRMARAMGLNTVATYVFWNVHEPQPGVYNFSGNADLAAFVRMAQEEGLYVLLRAGPYSCAEWELGGFPAWLLKTPEMQKALRSNDDAFMQPAERWLLRLGQEVAPLQIGRGGPILATQIENEYGNFGSDQAYMVHLKEIFVRAGFTDSLLYTADNWRNIPKGIIPGVYAATNFGIRNHEKGMDALAQVRPSQALFVSEYWPGWFDHWGHPHETRPIAPQLEDLDYILKHGTGVNIYMFHGGTSFGFMSGSSWTDQKFLPDVTSYDYDAPLDEAGHPTPKYFAYRELLAKYASAPLPPVPEAPPVVTVPDFALEQSSSLWQNLPQPVTSEDPQPMEHFSQSYGYILYRTHIAGPQNGNLELDELHDYAHIYLDGKLIGTVDRRLGQSSLPFTTTAASSQLDILVENSGRINSQGIMRTEVKGITHQVRLGGKPLTKWQIFSLPLNSIENLKYHSKPETESGPAFLRGHFQITTVGDVFLDVHNLSKGALWINGHAIGRFWNLGPQQTLLVPGPWLHQGKNEVVVFDWFGRQGATFPHLAGLPKPILDAPTRDTIGSKQE
ncbi:MAG TPA: beta-galactosidase [Terriglobales bacterium]|jgi:beta-galactosidase|nr:beta-galactosidase [Terriglobales bacterium]